jgi:hypothetical protein
MCDQLCLSLCYFKILRALVACVTARYCVRLSHVLLQDTVYTCHTCYCKILCAPVTCYCKILFVPVACVTARYCVHASQDVWFHHSCSEHPKWCHRLAPELNASCARQSRAVISKFFFQLWKYLKLSQRVFYLLSLEKSLCQYTDFQ